MEMDTTTPQHTRHARRESSRAGFLKKRVVLACVCVQANGGVTCETCKRETCKREEKSGNEIARQTKFYSILLFSAVPEEIHQVFTEAHRLLERSLGDVAEVAADVEHLE